VRAIAAYPCIFARIKDAPFAAITVSAIRSRGNGASSDYRFVNFTARYAEAYIGNERPPKTTSDSNSLSRTSELIAAAGAAGELESLSRARDDH